MCNSNSNIRTNNADITEPLNIDDMSGYFDKWMSDLNGSVATQIPIAIFSEIDFSHRISRQSGKFTFHGAVGTLSYPWNSTVINGKKIVDEIKINAEAVEEIRECLSALDITEKTIYRNTSTELDEICKEIREQELETFKQSIAKINDAVL